MCCGLKYAVQLCREKVHIFISTATATHPCKILFYLNKLTCLLIDLTATFILFIFSFILLCIILIRHILYVTLQNKCVIRQIHKCKALLSSSCSLWWWWWWWWTKMCTFCTLLLRQYLLAYWHNILCCILGSGSTHSSSTDVPANTPRSSAATGIRIQQICQWLKWPG